MLPKQAVCRRDGRWGPTLPSGESIGRIGRNQRSLYPTGSDETPDPDDGEYYVDDLMYQSVIRLFPEESDKEMLAMNYETIVKHWYFGERRPYRKEPSRAHPLAVSESGPGWLDCLRPFWQKRQQQKRSRAWAVIDSLATDLFVCSCGAFTGMEVAIEHRKRAAGHFNTQRVARKNGCGGVTQIDRDAIASTRLEQRRILHGVSRAGAQDTFGDPARHAVGSNVNQFHGPVSIGSINTDPKVCQNPPSDG